MKKQKVDFLICGFARSGTTHLSEWLGSQELVDIYNPRKPEPKFFSRDSNFANGPEWYLNTFFPNRSNFKLIGEKSTEYSESIDFPERLSKTFPSARLIYMVRDPIDRAISNYKWSVKNGFEKRSLNSALNDELLNGIEINGSLSTQVTRPFCYLGRSMYFQALQRVYKSISKDQILLVNFEKYRAGDESCLTAISNFLKISYSKESHQSINIGDRKTELHVESMGDSFRDLLLEDYQRVLEHFTLV